MISWSTGKRIEEEGVLEVRAECAEHCGSEGYNQFAWPSQGEEASEELKQSSKKIMLGKNSTRKGLEKGFMSSRGESDDS